MGSITAFFVLIREGSKPKFILQLHTNDSITTMKKLKPIIATRIRIKRYALVNQTGDLWNNLLTENRQEIYEAYGCRSVALLDGWKATPVAIYFDI